MNQDSRRQGQASSFDTSNLLNLNKSMTSSQVFSSFVKTVDGRETGEDILSEKCFKLWLITRCKSVIHPEESFRRTLIAHIRGAYGRKPFSAEVEESLLHLLRHGTVEKENAWERCFPGNSLHIGKRGFNKLGFHEAKSKDNSGSPKPSPSKKLKRTIEEIVDTPAPPLTAIKIPDQPVLKMPDYPTPTSSQLSERSLNRMEMESVMQQVQKLYEFSRSQEDLGHLKILATGFTSRYRYDDLVLMVSKIKEAGYDLLGPATEFFLKRADPFKEMGLDFDFQFPPEAECVFDKVLPTFQAIFCFRTWNYIDECDKTKKVLKRSIKGVHMFNVIESHIEYLLMAPYMYDRFQKNGEVWFRNRCIKGDGAPAIFLTRLVKRDLVSSTLYAQDQTHLFPMQGDRRRLC